MYPSAKQLIETGFEAVGYIVRIRRVHFLGQKGSLFVPEGYIVCVCYFDEGAAGYSLRHSFKVPSWGGQGCLDLYSLVILDTHSY